MEPGTAISDGILWVGLADRQGDGFGWAVDAAGVVYDGNPWYGMGRTDLDIGAVTIPDSDAPDADWRNWARRLRRKIRREKQRVYNCPTASARPSR